jgi:hypothetical protein
MRYKKGKALVAVVVASGLAVGLATAQGQGSGKVTVDVADCIKLKTADTRLACYASRVAAAVEEQGSAVVAEPARAAPGAPTPAAAPPSPEKTRVAAVGTSAPANTAPPAPIATDRQSRREERSRDPEIALPAEIVSRVAALRETVPNAYVITLENGQVWRQTVPKQYSLRPGHEVRIYGTRWGTALRLAATELKGYIQVERVR